MSVSTFNPNHDHHNHSTGCGGGNCTCGSSEPTPIDDGIRIMPTSDDLKRPHSEKQLIDDALADFHRPNNLIASSRQELPHITVNGVLIDPKAIAQEMQYHQADSSDDALFLSAQALVIRELLKQAVFQEPTLGQTAWGSDEEGAIARLLEVKISPQSPSLDTCRHYFEQNPQEFVAPPIVDVRHILLACPPDAGEERLELKKQAQSLIDDLLASNNKDADFIRFAQTYSSCPSKNDGGELGIIQKGATVPEFEKAVFASQKGICVNPIESRYGIHIVEIKSRQDGQELAFDDVYPMIENRLQQQSFHHHLCDYLFELSQNADIVGIDLKMNQDNIYRG